MSSGIHTDIEYGTADGESLLLDAFVPKGDATRSIVIIVHGGGWIGGDKQDMSLFYDPLSNANYTWFSINYRLAPKHRWPACLDDVQTAIRWVKANAKSYKGDASNIALLGYSAGGHLVCAAATDGKDDTSVQAVVGLAAPVDHRADSDRRGGVSTCMQDLLDCPKEIDSKTADKLRKVSPIHNVGSDLPPFLLIHGTEDQSVLYSQSIHLKAKLKEQNVPCQLVMIKGAPHRITEWPDYDAGYMQKMITWLDQTLNGKGIITVDAKRGGDYATVQAAVDAVPEGNASPVVISIQPGTYKERVVVPKGKRFIRFKGEDADSTILTFDLHANIEDETGQKIGTFRTPSVTIEAADFSAENMTFENSAGDVGQALAITVLGDRVIFRDCRFLGWQDTILDHAGRHYYEKCFIEGHCDFIFGAGTAFFETCHIHCLEGSYITAASTPQGHPYGYVFSNCKITGDYKKPKRTYLGRPWRDFANVIFLNTDMCDTIRPEGWHNWSKPHREKTAYYAEYNSTGAGANPKKRALWSHQLTTEEAEKITLSNVLSGDDGWDPLSGSVCLSSKSASESVSLEKK